jgi:hypothetical protein
MRRRAASLIGGTGLVFMAAYLTAMIAFPKPTGRVLVGDAVHHFVQLRSLVFDHDLHFQNEYVRVYGLSGEEAGVDWIYTELTSTGHVRNYMPVGPALLWAPLYVAAAAVQWIFASIGLAPRPDGFDLPLRLMPGLAGILAATAAAWLSWRLACRYVSEQWALLAVLAVWLGTHAIYYSLVSPAYSHAASMFASSLFFWHWLTTRAQPSIRRAAGWGALAGLAALMRWQDAILLAVPLIDLARWPVSGARRLAAGAAAVAAWIVVFSPQMAVWTVLYGQPLALPQGPAFMQWTAPHPIAVLFSDNHGLLTWTPLVACCLIGLAWFLRAHRAAVPGVLSYLLVSWYVNAAVADWWAGEAFGSRRFLSLFPLFVMGLAFWLAPRPAGPAGSARRDEPEEPRVRWAVTAVLVAANWLLLLQYQLFMKGFADLAPYPDGWFDMWLVRLIVPIRIVARWLS